MSFSTEDVRHLSSTELDATVTTNDLESCPAVNPAPFPGPSFKHLHTDFMDLMKFLKRSLACFSSQDVRFF